MLYKDEITDGVNNVKWTTCGTAAGIKGLAGSEHGSDTCKLVHSISFFPYTNLSDWSIQNSVKSKNFSVVLESMIFRLLG